MDKVIMPKSLTAENGAKKLLIGEFSEPISIFCEACGGDGEDECEEDGKCIYCDGTGHFEHFVTVSWTTIKEIYAKAVKHLSEPITGNVTTTAGGTGWAYRSEKVTHTGDR